MQFEIFIEMNNGLCLHSEVIEAASLEEAEARAGEVVSTFVRWGVTELPETEDQPADVPFLSAA